MKYIILIICSIFLPVFSLKETTPKHCINCKFFTNTLMTYNKYGKCTLFPKIEQNNVEFLVTGTTNNKNIDYNYCSIARKYDDMCGNEGTKYKPLSKKEHLKKKAIN